MLILILWMCKCRTKDVAVDSMLMRDSAHPTSPNFGRHWTAEEVNDRFAPSDDTIQTVRDWLVSHGISDSGIVVTANKGLGRRRSACVQSRGDIQNDLLRARERF